ncbi:hypothetical protein BH24ACT5_BH24ACT5_07200 [soil metagenome]
MNTGAYRMAVASFVVAIGGGLIAALGYATDHTEKMLGLGLAAAAVGIGLGLVSWARYLDLSEHVVQEREPLAVTPEQHHEISEEADLNRQTLGRRPLLVWLSGLSLTSLLVGFVGLIGSLGPKPRGERNRTSWRAGSRLVTLDGQPIDGEAGPTDQLVTVFPLGHVGVDDSQVVLLRVQPELLAAGTAVKSVNGWVAYSKICTHAGCSVGLFGVDARPPDTIRQLVCPCHQSAFDPLDGARPVGGPAPRSLPQLPLAVDDEGFLIATADFDRPVGPIAWDEA